MTIQEMGPLRHSAPVDTGEVSHARRIGGSLVWGQIGRVLEIGLGLLFSVLVVRFLGPQDYAVYAVVWSIVNVAALSVSLGYSEILTRYLPAPNLSDGGAAAALVRRLLQERVLVSLVIALGIWAGAQPLADWTHTPALQQLIGLTLALVVAQGLWELLIAYYTALLRMRDHAVVRMIGQIIGLGLALGLFVRVGAKVWVPLVAQLVSYLVSSALYVLGARHALALSGRASVPSAARRFGGYVWLTNLATFGLANQIDVLLIAALISDSTQISFYNVAALVLSRLYALLMGWSAIVMPAAAEAHSRDGARGMAQSFSLYMKVNLAVILPPLSFVIAWGEPLITAFFGEAFAPSSIFLRIFAAFGLVSALLGANICHPLLYVADRQRALLWLRLTAGALNIVLDVLLIPALGAAGAVIGTSVSNLVTHLIEFVIARRVIGGAYPAVVAIKVLSASLLAILPALFLPGTGWISLIIGGFLFGMIFFVIIRRMRLISPGDYATLENAVPRLRPVLRWFSTA